MWPTRPAMKNLLALVIAAAVFVPSIANAATPESTRLPKRAHRQKRKVSAISLVKKTDEEKAEHKERGAKKKKKALSEALFVASEPRVPLATVTQARDGMSIRSVGLKGSTCGPSSKWAKRGSKWIALDAYGQPIGTALVSGFDTNGETKCRELQFGRKSGKLGEGIYVSADSNWAASKSFEWSPDDAEKKSFDAFVHTMETHFTKDGADDAKAHSRALFFTTHDADAKSENKPARQEEQEKPTNKRTHRAVVGGNLLIVARLDSDKVWRIERLIPPGKESSSEFTPVGVLDMDKDGDAEIVYHASNGWEAGDAVMTQAPTGWKDVALSAWSNRKH